VTAADNGNSGNGIAPYNPSEGSSGSMSNQDGITDSVPENSAGGSYSNILEVYLNSSIANGSTLSFLLQEGVSASGDTVSVFTANASTPQNPSGMNVFNNSVASPIGGITTTGTTSQFTITKTSTNEFVAIEADCHYLLLTSITATPGTVPEPSFYGFFALAMVGLVFSARKMRARAAVAAAEKA
jgi:hypothetical protein